MTCVLPYQGRVERLYWIKEPPSNLQVSTKQRLYIKNSVSQHLIRTRKIHRINLRIPQVTWKFQQGQDFIPAVSVGKPSRERVTW